MRESLNKIKAFFSEQIDKIKDSDSYHELKAKYDELDAQTKTKINFSVLGALVVLILITVFTGITKVNTLKNDFAEREAVINYLLDNEDKIKQFKAIREAQSGSADLNSPLKEFVEKTAQSSKILLDKIQLSEERPGADTKEAKEILVDLNLTQTNLRTLTQFLFNLSDQGSPRNLSIKELTIDTKSDPSGYLDASMTIASYKSN